LFPLLFSRDELFFKFYDVPEKNLIGNQSFFPISFDGDSGEGLTKNVRKGEMVGNDGD